MSVVITEQCVTCGACVWECPNEAISAGAPRPVVRDTQCTECYGFFGESQCIVVCPVAAIKVRLEPTDALERRFNQLHPGTRAQDTWVWHRIGQGAGPV